MAEIITLLLEWWALGLVAILGVGVVLFLGGRVLAKLKAFRKAGPAVVVLAIAAIIHGGTKNILNRFASDPGLTVTKAELTVPTNATDNAFLVYSWIGPDESQPLYIRESVHESWGALGEGWLFDDRFFENGTNTATWCVEAPASNILPHAMYYLGNDLPPVEVDGDGVTIQDFRASSTNVVLTYAIEHACLGVHAGTARVEVQEVRGAVWVEVSAVTVEGGVTNTVTFPGFWVGRDTRWRVRLEVEQ